MTDDLRKRVTDKVAEIDRYMSAQYPNWRKFPPKQVGSALIADQLLLLTHIDMVEAENAKLRAVAEVTFEVLNKGDKNDPAQTLTLAMSEVFQIVSKLRRAGFGDA